MKVGLIGPADPDSFVDNLQHCLPDLGVEVVMLGSPAPENQNYRLRRLIDFAARASLRLDESLQSKLFELAREHGCDLVISVSESLLPSVVEKFVRHGIPIVHWFPDAISNLARQFILEANYARVYAKDPVLVERIRAMTRVPIAYLPEACNPKWHRPVGPYGISDSVSIAGNLYPSRMRVLDRLAEDNVPLRLYGSGVVPKWMNAASVASCISREYIVRERKSEIFRASRAVLNNLHPSELGSLNCRLFEATAAGALVLCEYRPALEDLFALGDEVLAFRTYDELLALVRKCFDEPDTMRQIADSASTRALRDHTYQHRLRRILDDCAQ